MHEDITLEELREAKKALAAHTLALVDAFEDVTGVNIASLCVPPASGVALDNARHARYCNITLDLQI